MRYKNTKVTFRFYSTKKKNVWYCCMQYKNRKVTFGFFIGDVEGSPTFLFNQMKIRMYVSTFYPQKKQCYQMCLFAL